MSTMFLQDLIRNVVIYKGVMKPYIASWREYLSALYAKQNSIYAYQISEWPLPKSKKHRSRFRLYFESTMKIAAFPLANESGTRTITKVKVGLHDIIASHHALFGHKRNGTSNNMIAVLTDEQYSDNIDMSAKIAHSYTDATEFVIILSSNNSYSSTTGFTKKNVNTFLISETHEKREYLGEFSLTHEEIPLQYLKRGGDEHAIDEKPITASF